MLKKKLRGLNSKLKEIKNQLKSHILYYRSFFERGSQQQFRLPHFFGGVIHQYY